VTVTATDPSGNAATAVYEVDQVPASKAFSYDANGNLTSDGTRTFEWDARNQLVAVTVGTHRSEFTYDGIQRRVREIEKENTIVQSDIRVLWCGNELCEERAADGTTVTRRAFAGGEQIGGARYFATDHLGSVSEVSDGSATLLGRYAFDPWGRRTLVAGTDITRVGFTGHRWQAAESVWLTKYRALDSESGRWLSEDPIGFTGSDNFYEYAEDSPVRYRDPNGLTVWVCVRDMHGAYGLAGLVANHTYLWDDRNNKCCGAMSRTNCSEGGPTKDRCRPVKGSGGNENLIMGCCKSIYSDENYVPYVNDCVTTVDGCLKKLGFANPNPTTRVGPK
jgi:RHS repeat-associated protein